MGLAGWEQALANRLADLDRRHLIRRRRTVEGPTGPRRLVDGRELLCFASNDYLGLAADPRVVAAFQRGLDSHGAGSGAAHLLGGHTGAHGELEAALADWLGYPRVLLFSTGYMANLGLVTCLSGRGRPLIADPLNHASLIDGARLAGARQWRYTHADAATAGDCLRAAGPGALVVTDGVFSMDGDLAPLADLAALCRAHEAPLIVDDAHGIGVLGPDGRGSVAAAGLGKDDVPALVGTLGKALGTFGAFVAGDTALIETLVNRARSYLFTTAGPPALAIAATTAIDLCRRESWRRDRLVELVQRFRRGAGELGYRLLPSSTPIQPLVLGSAERALAVSSQLEQAGIWVPAVRPPTVPEGECRLRITFSAAHQDNDVDHLLSALEAVRAPA